MTFQMVYASSATTLFSDAQLGELLAVSRRNNASVGVTGMLLYRGGNFIQVLEGERAEVERVYARVEADDRHRGVLRLIHAEVAVAEFADWSMGFRNLNDRALLTTAGFSEFLNDDGFAPPLTSSRALKLLRTFRQNFR